MPLLIIEILSVCSGIFLGAIVGFGGQFISIPLLLFILPFKEALALMTIFFFATSAIMMFVARKNIDTKAVKALVIGAIIGSVIGLYLLQTANPVLLKKAFGILILLYIGYTRIKKTKIPLFRQLGVVFGILGGIMSSLFMSGGPIFVTYLDNKSDHAKTVRASLFAILTITNTLAIILFYNSHILTPKIISMSLPILPFFFLTLYFGQRTYKNLHEDLLARLILLFFFISGISLII